MLKIESLLNPSAALSPTDSTLDTKPTTISPPLTPALVSTASMSPYSLPMSMPEAPASAKRQKLVKDAPIFVKGDAKGKVHYPPHEVNDDTISLPPWQREELGHQHRRFKIYPSGNEAEGLIANFTRRIPYSSEKKEWSGKAGFEGFDVFQYTFIVPDDEGKKLHTVMWDYSNGLVRITPFFKALKYSKTTPAKALNVNPGLRELSLSVTGGALVAQGYWMPFACARAICLTFAYPIRWALTPIFGPNFIRECVPPGHPSFATFRIDPEIVRSGQKGVHGYKVQQGKKTEIPKSVPVQQHVVPHGTAVGRPVFKLGSPFDSDHSRPSTAAANYGREDVPPALNSPPVSPKSTPSGWTTVNQQVRYDSGRSAPPSPPPNTPCNVLDASLLNQPTHPPWRSAQHNTATATKKTASSGKRARRDSIDSDYDDSSSSDFTSDDLDILAAPTTRMGASHGGQGKERVGRAHTTTKVSSGRRASQRLKVKKGPTTKYSKEDERAAILLLGLGQGGQGGRW